LGNVSRQDLDRLFDEPSHPAVPRTGVSAPPTGEAAALFGDDELSAGIEDDEVASLFEESTSDSVPNALVPSRLKPCRNVIIGPTSRKALSPPSRSKRWPQLKPALGSKPAPTPAEAKAATEPQVDPEDSPTIPTLPKLPRIIESRPLATAAPKPAPAPEPKPKPEMALEPEEMDTQPDLPLVPTPKELPQIADVLEPEVKPEPKPRLEPVETQPAPQPKPEPRPKLELVETQPTPQPLTRTPTPAPVAETPKPTPHTDHPILMPVSVEPDPTLQVVRRPRKRKVSLAAAAGTFVAGVAVTSLLFLALVPWNQPETVVIKTTQPDQAMRPLATPLAEPTQATPAAPALAKARAPRTATQIETVVQTIPYPGAVPLPEPPDTAANRAGIKIGKLIKPCLSGRALFYQRIGVRMNSWGAVWKGLIDAKWGADEKAQACVKSKLKDLRLPKLPTGRYVEWHLSLQGDSPKAWVTYPRELKVRR